MRLPLVLLTLFLLPLFANADTLVGHVAKVVDGDTVYALDADQEQHKIRLSGIDTPERKQPFGQKAKQHLSDLVADRQVRVDWSKRDRYKRIVGKIIHNDRDVEPGDGAGRTGVVVSQVRTGADTGGSGALRGRREQSAVGTGRFVE